MTKKIEIDSVLSRIERKIVNINYRYLGNKKPENVVNNHLKPFYVNK